MKNKISATIFLTKKCNLGCKYCYEKDKQAQDLTIEQLDKELLFLVTNEYYSQADEITIDFFGGEPFLKPDLMRHAMTVFPELCAKYNPKWLGEINYGTSTNGTLLLTEKVQEVIRDFPELKISVSLDGIKEIHDMNRPYLNGKGTYDDIVAGVNWLHRYRKSIAVKGTFNREALPKLAESMKEQLKLGFNKVWINPIAEETWTEADGELYYAQLKEAIDYTFDNNLQNSIKEPIGGGCGTICDTYCGTGKWMVAIDIDGKLYPCPRGTTEKIRYCIGDIEKGVDYDRLQEYLDGVNAIGPTMTKAFPKCYAYAYGLNGKFEYKNDSMWHMAKSFFRAGMYWQARMKEIEYGWR